MSVGPYKAFGYYWVGISHRVWWNRSHKPDESMVACSVPDIQGLEADTFKGPGSTAVPLLSFGTKRLCFALDLEKALL